MPVMLKVALLKPGGRVLVGAPIGTGEPGTPVGGMMQELGPGWKYWGKTYEEWKSLPEGLHEIPADVEFDDYAPPGVGEPTDD